MKHLKTAATNEYLFKVILKVLWGPFVCFIEEIWRMLKTLEMYSYIYGCSLIKWVRTNGAWGLRVTALLLEE